MYLSLMISLKTSKSFEKHFNKVEDEKQEIEREREPEEDELNVCAAVYRQCLENENKRQRCENKTLHFKYVYTVFYAGRGGDISLN